MFAVGCARRGLQVQPSAAQAEVLRVAGAFRSGGGYRSLGSGAPKALHAAGVQVLAAGDEGTTHCSGFTFAVMWTVAEARGLIARFSPDQLHHLQRAWFGAEGDAERQAGPALAALAIGDSVPLEACMPGDFVQFWRGRTGHSAVLLEWRGEGARRTGLRYRSSQASTAGIGDHEEYFSDAEGPDGKRGEVDRQRTYCARLDEAARIGVSSAAP